VNPDKSRLEVSKVDTFEIKDEEINVEEIMEKIRENIKKRKENDDYNDGSFEEIEQVFSEISSSRKRSSQELEGINSNCNIRNNSYSISSHRPILGNFLVKGRELVHGEVRRYVDPVFQKQSELNYNFVDLLGGTKEVADDAKEIAETCSNSIEQLKTEVEVLEDENKALNHKIKQLNDEVKRLKVESKQLKSEIISDIIKEVEPLISAINLDLDNKDRLGEILKSRIQKESESQVMCSSEMANSDINYYEFEERFRGPRESILQHQTGFINYFANCTNVLDIGCGRGEFLELAKDKGIIARGIDVDKDMIDFCKSKGLNVELKDAIKALEEIEDKSLDGIFISQVVEHLSPNYLINMLNLCNMKMKYGSYIIVETVNPLSLFSFANFYIDLSHVKPVHPETLKFLVDMAGFRDVETKFSSPVPPEMRLQKLPNLDNQDEETPMIEICNQNIDMINNALYGAQDYAIIGKK
jgi:2-polyprenyl-3-methyl-5-hydroxy-6-metoxy-1,4-benzoquinol methylase